MSVRKVTLSRVFLFLYSLCVAACSTSTSVKENDPPNKGTSTEGASDSGVLLEQDAGRTGEKTWKMPQMQTCQSNFSSTAESQNLQKGTELVEFSGIAQSLRQNNLYWGHNDHGNENHIYAVNSRGEILAYFDIADQSVIDLEDIASAQCPDRVAPCLYIFDIGDNRYQRAYSQIYIYQEPNLNPLLTDLTDSGQNISDPIQKVEAELLYKFKVSYINGATNAEAGMVSADGQNLYVIEKTDNLTSTIYSFDFVAFLKNSSNQETVYRYKNKGKVKNPGAASAQARTRRITGAALHSTGSELLIRTYGGLYQYKMSAEQDLSSLLDITPILIAEPHEPQGEAVCYTFNGLDIITVSEDPPQTNNPAFNLFKCLHN